MPGTRPSTRWTNRTRWTAAASRSRPTAATGGRRRRSIDRNASRRRPLCGVEGQRASALQDDRLARFVRHGHWELGVGRFGSRNARIRRSRRFPDSRVAADTSSMIGQSTRRRAQSVRAAAPGPAGRGRRTALTDRCSSHGARIAGGHDGDAFGLFALGVGVIRLAIEAEQRRDLRVGPPRQQRQPPSEQRRREPQRADRVAGVVLAVAERALPVLPRFAPVNRRQRDEKAGLARPSTASKTQRSSSACSRARVVPDAAVVDRRRPRSDADCRSTD